MHYYKTVHNLVVVDFKCLVDEVKLSYRNFFNTCDSDGPLLKKDVNRLLLYYTLFQIIFTRNCFENKKNIVFYVEHDADKDIFKHLVTISKYFPILYYKDTFTFDTIKRTDGAGIDLNNKLQETRLSHDFSTYTKKMRTDFFKKFGIKELDFRS